MFVSNNIRNRQMTEHKKALTYEQARGILTNGLCCARAGKVSEARDCLNATAHTAYEPLRSLREQTAAAVRHEMHKRFPADMDAARRRAEVLRLMDEIK